MTPLTTQGEQYQELNVELSVALGIDRPHIQTVAGRQGGKATVASDNNTSEEEKNVIMQ